MWGLMLVLLSLYMSVRWLGAHVIDAIGMHSSVRVMRKDWRRVCDWREGTPHILLELLLMHRWSGVGASWSIRLGRQRTGRRKGMAAISTR